MSYYASFVYIVEELSWVMKHMAAVSIIAFRQKFYNYNKTRVFQVNKCLIKIYVIIYYSNISFITTHFSKDIV